MIIPQLKVGANVNIVFENEINKSNAHFMKALVYDIQDRKIIISQTSPALNRNFLNRRIMVSFLSRIERRNLRFGFPAKLIDLVSDYKIASQQIVEALVLQQYEDSEQIDFRTFFRVKPPMQSDINLFLKEEKVKLIDISLAGAKFICPKDNLLQAADKVKFKLLIGPSVFDLETRVREVRTPDDVLGNKNLQYVSVEFEYDNKQLEAALGKAILAIERQLLSEGKI
jgi:hypothetical protein